MATIRPEFGNSLATPTMDLSVDEIMAMLDAPGTGYTPELTAQTLDMIKKRNALNTATMVADSQSDALARGGTGSSTEGYLMNDARARGLALEEDQTLQFMLGAADRAAQDRQFRVGMASGLYSTGVGQLESAYGRQFEYGSDVLDRENEQRLADKYMAQLAQQRAEERKSARRRAIAGGIGSVVGAVGGGFMGGPAGAGAGANIGSNLGFLFA